MKRKGSNYSLEGLVAIITGASRGLGLAIAQAYVRAGASICMCARDAALLQQAIEKIEKIAAGQQKIIAQVADVSNQEDVEKLVQSVIREFSQVHILVNNAGIYGPIGLVEEADWDAWVMAIKINLLGSVLMCRALLPHFKNHHYGKIVQLSGGGATSPMPYFSAYAASKAAVVRFIETLAEEVRSDCIDVNALAPGVLNTRMQDEVLEASPEKAGSAYYKRMVKVKSQGGASLDNAANLAVFLGSAASDGLTGKLISAVWDPWENLPEHLEDLQITDVYTLRRIVPKERGMKWGER